MNKKVVIILLLILTGLLLTINNMKSQKEVPEGVKFSDTNKAQKAMFGSNGEKSVSTAEDNSSDELRAVLVKLSKMENEVTNLRTKVKGYETSRPSAEIEADVNKLKRELAIKDKEVDKLNKQIGNVKSSKTTKNTKKNSVDTNVNKQLGVNNTYPMGTKNNDDDSIPILTRPGSKKKTTQTPAMNLSGNKVTSNRQRTTGTSEAVVWYEPDDAVVSETKDGTTSSITYPFSSEDISGVTLANNSNENLEKGKDGQNKKGTGSEGNIEKGDDKDKKESTAHEIYTIPNNSTLWDAISIGSMIGRVPQGGTLKNPYGFKVLLSNDNMASNGMYIPNLKDMVLSGYLEGDMLMECLRGTIDSITYTFNDGRIATSGGGQGSGGESGTLAHISDQWGNECIPGTYVSTLAKYLEYVGSASAIESVGELLSDAGTTTTTDGDSVTTVLSSSSSASSVVGAALEGSASSAADYISDQMEDAFSAVIIEAGEPLVIHVDTQINIDYDTMGRKLVNEENVEEFLN